MSDIRILVVVHKRKIGKMFVALSWFLDYIFKYIGNESMMKAVGIDYLKRCLPGNTGTTMDNVHCKTQTTLVSIC